MNFDLELTYLDYKNILEANGYVLEEVSVYYDKYANYYQHGSEKKYHDDEFCTHKVLVAYKEGERPEEFDKQPLDVVNPSWDWENVFKKLVKEKFVSFMCN